MVRESPRLSRWDTHRSFVAALVTDEDNTDMVRSIIGLARNLGFGLIAEGVERQEQLRHLKQMDCDEVQGFLLGHPVDSAGATALLAEQEASVEDIWVGPDFESPDQED